MSFKSWILILCLLLVGWLVYIADAGGMIDIADALDRRPTRTILFVGNSHTYTHDVPGLVRKIADKVHGPYKYKITMYVQPGQTFEGHWNDPMLQDQLQQSWDAVMIQGATYEALYDNNPINIAKFHQYGGQIIDKAHIKSQHVGLNVVWNENAKGYGKNWAFNIAGKLFFLTEQAKSQILASMYNSLQREHRKLATQHNADLVNVGQAWEMARQQYPTIPLYGPDEHHASIHGAYLSALVIYRYLSNNTTLPEDLYAPPEISAADASALRSVAQSVR